MHLLPTVQAVKVRCTLRPCKMCSLQTGNEEDIAKYSKRTIRVTQQHSEECKRLLELMGVPIVVVRFCISCAANACELRDLRVGYT